MVEDCGYSKNEVSKIFYKVPNMGISDGLREMFDDSTTFGLLKYVSDGGSLDTYMEHTVSAPTYNATMVSPLDSKGIRLVVDLNEHAHEFEYSKGNDSRHNVGDIGLTDDEIFKIL
uniref:Uncharacterized protein n=1 Tax=Nelumbo nucifera TaxID=4432 RepID=A0A822ZM63_NELNU|nr:TPA_asm: hypothetical protein HUJ06_003790 [Nelumbo nucifera]